MMTLQEFKLEVARCAKDVGVEPKEIHVRQMKRKLASCSSRGRLTFDASLLMEQTEPRLRAILHELLHLRFPNHGKMFRSLLNAHLQKQLDAYRRGGQRPGM